MKQKIIIPNQTYDLKNDYVTLSSPVVSSQYAARGYVVKPKDPKFFKLLTEDSQSDKEFVLNIDLKKDPRRAASTKASNPLLFSFGTLFEDSQLSADLTINMPKSSDTTLNIIMNQFLLPLQQQPKHSNSTLTINGSLNNIYIDRSNSFEKINIVHNNVTELYSNDANRYYSRAIRFHLIDNTIKELNCTFDPAVPKNAKPTYEFPALMSYSLEKITLEGYKLELFNSSFKNIQLQNLKELNLEKLDFIDIGFANITVDFPDKVIAKRFNKSAKIKINPMTRIKTHWEHKEQYPTIKQTWKLKTDKPIELTIDELIKLINQKNKQEQKGITK